MLTQYPALSQPQHRYSVFMSFSRLFVYYAYTTIPNKILLTPTIFNFLLESLFSAYYNRHRKREATAHKVVSLKIRSLKKSLVRPRQKWLFYFRLLFLSMQASSAIRNEPPKNNRLKTSYISISTTSPLSLVWEATTLYTISSHVGSVSQFT